jgi:hypothetical protein
MHRQYLALRSFFVDGRTAEQVADASGYSVSTVYSMVRDFKGKIGTGTEDPFFKTNRTGRKPTAHKEDVRETVISMRKRYLSVPDIQVALDAMGINMAIYSIEKIISDAGFARLPRRDRQFREEARSSSVPKLSAPVTERLTFAPESFSTQFAGLLCMLPFIVRYGIDEAIGHSPYPGTKDVGRDASILSFVALKLLDVKRYSADDAWCMDRGKGLFAGHNVLPKAAWFNSYSSRVTRDMNVSFLGSLQSVWDESGMLSDTANLDFTAIPYWGDDGPFENNWSGKRGKALASIQAVLAQDPDSGILCYGDTTVRHENQNDVVLEFLDFYHGDEGADSKLKYLVFGSKFTTYHNLNALNQRGIKFITIRRRGRKLVEKINSLDPSLWQKVDVPKAGGGARTVTACDDRDGLAGYEGSIRQVYIKDNGKAQPAILITNEFDMKLVDLIRKYSRRWLVETDISEHIDFFHLNRNSSGIVVKVDFDLTMTILAHNLYRLFCKGLAGYTNCGAQTIFDKFISAPGSVEIGEEFITVKLKKKRTLPVLIQHLRRFDGMQYPWLGNRRIAFTVDSTS